MDWQVRSSVPYNSAEYFEQTLITDNGFREYDVRWRLGQEVNPNGFVLLGRAFGTYVREELKLGEVVVGHDFRSYSQNLERSFVLGLLSAGVNVKDIGLALSPILYFSQHHLGIKAGAMLTASHNANGWTGLKLADGLSSTLGPAGIQKFKEIVKGGRFASGAGKYEAVSGVADAYMADIVRGQRLRPIDTVVATGNGTAGRFAPPALRALGCNVIEVDGELNWDFPKFNPNPEDLAFLKSIGEASRQHHAKVGFGIDGDGDRIGFVDETGEEVFSDKVALLVARWIARHTPGKQVVIDVKSTGLFYSDPVLRETKTTVKMVKTGHSYVKAAVKEPNSIAGFERSGHWFFNEPYGRGYDDAVRACSVMLRMLDESGASLSQMLAELPRTWQSPTLSPRCPDHEKYAVVDQLTELYRKDLDAGVKIGGMRIKDLVTVNGVRFVLEDNSWGLIRASSNIPSLVVVAESCTSEDLLYAIVEQIHGRLMTTGKIGEYDQKMPERGHA